MTPMLDEGPVRGSARSAHPIPRGKSRSAKDDIRPDDQGNAEAQKLVQSMPDLQQENQLAPAERRVTARADAFEQAEAALPCSCR